MNKPKQEQPTEEYTEFKREAIKGDAKTLVFKSKLEEVSTEYKAILESKQIHELKKSERLSKLVSLSERYNRAADQREPKSSANEQRPAASHRGKGERDERVGD